MLLKQSDRVAIRRDLKQIVPQHCTHTHKDISTCVSSIAPKRLAGFRFAEVPSCSLEADPHTETRPFLEHAFAMGSMKALEHLRA